MPTNKAVIGNAELWHRDCLEEMRGMAGNSIDAIVTDPPYGLSFMGKEWDHGVPGLPFWTEALRVLKPGGYLLAFGGTKTFHRLAVAIEDAGFEIRDTLMWVYGSGFPKSLDVSKAIDKAGGCNPATVAQILWQRREESGLSREQVAEAVGSTVASVRDWEEGRARAKGRAIEHITPSEGYRAKLADLLGYTKDERRLCGLSVDRRGDGTTYGIGHSGQLWKGGQTEAAKQWDGWGTALKPAWEPVIMARKPLDGTVAANVLKHGTGGINVDGCRLEGRERTEYGLSMSKRSHRNTYAKPSGSADFDSSKGRWPANLVHDGSDEVLAGFPETKSGKQAAGGHTRNSDKTRNAFGKFKGQRCEGDVLYGDSGSAARFYYCAKASKAERGDGNKHPTVKPLALMRWLVRMVTPPGGTVLDPFMGSGTTGVAAALEGFRFIGCELDPEYIAIAERRIASA